jgi:hypothetical protein
VLVKNPEKPLFPGVKFPWHSRENMVGSGVERCGQDHCSCLILGGNALDKWKINKFLLIFEESFTLLTCSSHYANFHFSLKICLMTGGEYRLYSPLFLRGLLSQVVLQSFPTHAI